MQRRTPLPVRRIRPLDPLKITDEQTAGVGVIPCEIHVFIQHEQAQHPIDAAVHQPLFWGRQQAQISGAGIDIAQIQIGRAVADGVKTVRSILVVAVCDITVYPT